MVVLKKEPRGYQGSSQYLVLTMYGPSSQQAQFYSNDYDPSIIVIVDGVRDRRRYQSLIEAVREYNRQGFDA